MTTEQEWTLDKRRSIYMTLVSFPLFIVGLVLFAGLNSVLRPHYALQFTVSPQQGVGLVIAWFCGAMLGIFLLTALVLVIHEGCHGLAFHWAGATPRYGAKMISGFCPILYATAPGAWLTRRQYITVALAPTVLVNLLGILVCLPPSPLRMMMVLPMGMHFAGCVGDWWMTLVLLKLPPSTMVQDTMEGFRYRLLSADPES